MGISTPTIIMTISWDIAHQQCVAGLSQNARYIYMPISMRRLMRNHGVLGYPILRQAQMMLLKTVFNPVWGEVLLYTFGKRLVSMSLDLGNPSPWNDCSRFFRSWWQPLKSLATILGSNDQKRSQFGSLGSLGVIFRQFVFYFIKESAGQRFRFHDDLEEVRVQFNSRCLWPWHSNGELSGSQIQPPFPHLPGEGL